MSEFSALFICNYNQRPLGEPANKSDRGVVNQRDNASDIAEKYFPAADNFPLKFIINKLCFV